MKNSKKLSLVEEKIIELYNNGYNDQEIGKKVGFSNMKIFRFRKKHGLKTKQIQGVLKLYSEEEKKLIFELHDEGYTITNIAKEIGVANQTLAKFCKSEGMDTSFARIVNKHKKLSYDLAKNSGLVFNEEKLDSKSDLYKKIYEHYKRTCSICESKERLHVHHKNNDPYDNRFDNLSLLCSKCHAKVHWNFIILNAQTSTSYDGLCEYVSRKTRTIIVKSLGNEVSKLYFNDYVKKYRSPYSSGSSLIAYALNVTRVTVDRWMHGNISMSNSNLLKLMMISKYVMPTQLKEFLIEDLAQHETEIMLFNNGAMH